MSSQGTPVIEPVECLRCGKPIEMRAYTDSGVDLLHDHVGAGYTETELLAIGGGDRGYGIVRVVQNAREYCMSPGAQKPLAGYRFR